VLEGATSGNFREHQYSIRYDSRALGRILEREAASAFRAGLDFSSQFFDFFGLSQHRKGEHAD